VKNNSNENLFKFTKVTTDTEQPEVNTESKNKDTDNVKNIVEDFKEIINNRPVEPVEDLTFEDVKNKINELCQLLSLA
tara:strand:+ start:1406 stop:1639 length:234 start_codon:yes stop_codon:yes gene_type:complete